MYYYLSIRSNDTYSCFSEVENLNNFLSKMGCLKKQNPLEWRYRDSDLSIDIALLQCIQNGSYAIERRKQGWYKQNGYF